MSRATTFMSSLLLFLSHKVGLRQGLAGFLICRCRVSGVGVSVCGCGGGGMGNREELCGTRMPKGRRVL